MKPVPVTDHAVVRYLERVLGLPVEQLRRHIGMEVARGLDRVGGLPPPSGVNVDGWVHVIQDGRVVTIEAAHRPDLRTGRQRAPRRDAGD